MAEDQVRQDDYPTVSLVMDAIADWVNKYRALADVRHEFGQCSPEDVRQIAKDLGIPIDDLCAMSARNPHAADLMLKMLTALSVNPEALAKCEPATMRDLQRLCTSCGHKSRCAHELAEGTAVEHFKSFCPNAFTLDALMKPKERALH